MTYKQYQTLLENASCTLNKISKCLDQTFSETSCLNLERYPSTAKLSRSSICHDVDTMLTIAPWKRKTHNMGEHSLLVPNK